MSQKNKVEVRIAGYDYTLVGTESDEYIQKIGLYVDKKMNEIMKANSKLSTSMAAILTAINVADDYFKTYEREAKAKDELEQCKEELEKLKQEKQRLISANKALADKSTALQLELAKREAELKEVRNSLDKASMYKVVGER
ncbi:cell division protein ZapA [Clostridium thermosuccinogenes]|uniref:Cell division protein ZapA n=1 Tax=Clostridium thermosuccinogenes TaxID=84032 RepID=A0A2K2EYC6_9CLOT|nr:cell division protein ZapA [Pseudoclostridium thermosuccinogenes]AUS95164.1 cell division protein ZapA [Pseudoclostridium thermosuccinogenes]PNT91537.1 cell division protein ZapA [Pseudoclostridium thermosuccinogenes]PNT99116.1 cell division protein ZapA [Pseudoclostridium thermosuccinogenes]PNU00920.1 cell division protein ZapA [Pseudoclostridium thermosuccinogenes]